MPAKRFLAEPIKNTNYFLALAGDSDEDCAEAVAVAVVVTMPETVPEPVAEAVVEPEAAVAAQEPQPYREWNSEVSRFANDMKKNLFSSPFSKVPSTRGTANPKSLFGTFDANRSRPEKEWTSIRWNQPQFIDTECEGEAEAEAEPDADREIVLEETITPSEESGTKNITALVWAERIKQSLEKAELAREEKAKKVNPAEFKEALGRLSFFRRPVAQVE
jgi:hypothetical protein